MHSLAGRRVAIISRIYGPEPGAASFRLGSLARVLRDRGAEVTVRTTTRPAGYEGDPPDHEGITIRRAWALRDRAGYIRGYLQYMSFDIPAFFRVLFSRRVDFVIVEPPPTTGAVVRIACALRRIPYAYYAADVWSDAVELTEAPSLVARVVRTFERFAYRGAAVVVSVSEDFTARIRAIAPTARIATVGNGFDESLFSDEGMHRSLAGPYLLYAGTASEVHGAGVFVEAMPAVRAAVPDARLVFVGQGADRAAMQARADELAPGAVQFHPRLSPQETAEWIRGAAASLASMRPEGRYRAFPAKMHASVGCGTPVVYAGDDPGRSFTEINGIGWGVDYDVDAAATAMISALTRPRDDGERRRLARWARENVSLRAVSERFVEAVESAPAQRRPPASPQESDR
ncbi:glycosyltransferase family 4 protein [Microbacterium sp. NPDC055910]|uniref:glycosyltransferase family 4 protein n=1 Tax=Microbacterium sp. NPDC055910 TaxID=3345659 RepID=UPI0035E15831